MTGTRLLLLGGFELRDGSGALVRLPTRKAQALLAYLALESRRAHPRDALANLLWPDAPEANARATLRQTLSLLNKALGPGVLETSARTAALRPGALQVDAVELAAQATAESPAAWQAGADLYRGDLLDALAIDEAPFEEWLLEQRRRLREVMTSMLARLAARHEELGDTARAIDGAHRLLALDPLDESTHRMLMRLFAAQGRRGAALRQYEVCVNVLQRELDTEPEARTRALFDTVLRQREDQPTHVQRRAGMAERATAGAQSGPAPGAPLVGRHDVLAAMTALLAPSRAPGTSNTLILTGEAGIGKSRLVAELAANAGARSVRVLVGHCHESQQQDPFVPWIDLLRAAGVARDAALLKELGTPWRRELGRLLPELAGAQDQLEDDRLSFGQSGRLFDAVVRLVQCLSARAPLLLVLEDVHWADDMSLRLLATLGRRLEAAPVLIAATARDEELAPSRSLQRALSELEGLDALVRIELAPLSRDETMTLLAGLVRASPGDASAAKLAEYVWRTSEGNPFVVIETVHAIGAGAAPEAARPRSGAPGFPRRVRDLIEGHLARLSPVARRLANAAAIAASASEFALLQRAAGLQEQAAAEAIDELVRRRVLRTAGELFEFTHDRIRHVAEAGLLEPARSVLHAALGEAYEALYGADVPEVYDRLAYHYARSARSDKAVYYLTRLAERAARAGAHERAMGALDEALAHTLRRGSGSDARTRFELAFRKSRSALLLGRLEEVVSLLSAQQAFVDASGDERLAGLYYVRLGAACSYLGDEAQSAGHCTRALAAATACGDLGTMGKAHAILALHHFWAQPVLGAQHGQQAMLLLARADDRWWLGQASWIHGLNLCYRGRLAEGLEMQASAIAIGDALGDRRLQCSATWADGFIRALAGDLEPALASCVKAVALAPDPMARMVSLGMLALVHVERAEPRQAIALLDEAIAAAQKFHIPRLEGLFRGFRGEAALQIGDLESAQAFATQGVRLTLDSGYVYGLGWSQRILGRIAQARGDAQQARDCLAQAIAAFDGMQAPFEVARARLELARWLESAGNRKAAREQSQRAHAALAELGMQHRARPHSNAQ